MSVRQFISQVVLTLLVLIAANMAVKRMAANSIPRQLLRTAAQAEPATDLFIGNSTMAAGIDERAFAAAKPGSRPLNLGLGSSSPVEHDLIDRQQAKHRSAAVYYGFLDIQLTEAPSGDWGTLVGNRALAYYVDPHIAMKYYASDSLMNQILFRIVMNIPVAMERFAIWAKVERFRRLLSSIGLPKKETNRFGQADDFALLELDEAEFRSHCMQVVNEQKPLSTPILAIMSRARTAGVPMYLIEMPMPASHRKRYFETPEWLAYHQYLTRVINDAGGTLIPASDWVPDSGFADHVHLNAEGARLFSEKLGVWVKSR